jgi:diacylglycerol kinase family enzyme
MSPAFSGRLRYLLDNGPREKAEALVFMCPLTSRALDENEEALEAAALDIKGAADALKLGYQALVGDWRNADAVEAQRCQVARIWAAHGIPAILDGESVKLKALAEVVYRPNLVRVLAIPKDTPA